MNTQKFPEDFKLGLINCFGGKMSGQCYHTGEVKINKENNVAASSHCF